MMVARLIHRNENVVCSPTSAVDMMMNVLLYLFKEVQMVEKQRSPDHRWSLLPRVSPPASSPFVPITRWERNTLVCSDEVLRAVIHRTPC